MKKILLFFFVLIILGENADAQLRKSTRTYDHQMYIEMISSPMKGRLAYLWQDASILIKNDSGTSAAPYSSVSQTIFPFDMLWNDYTNPYFLGLMPIKFGDSYYVDSVSIDGFYLLGTSASTSVVDTLIISVGYQPAKDKQVWLKSVYPWAANYLPLSKDSLITTAPSQVDSLNKMVLSNPRSSKTATLRIPLTASMRKVFDKIENYQHFSFKLDTPLFVPAGNTTVVSYTFRSGDTWKRGLDSIHQKHHFCPLFAYNTIDTFEISRKQFYTHINFDNNMSSIMLSSDSSKYLPTLVIGAMGDTTKWYHHYLMNTVSLSCPSCDLGGVESVKTIGSLLNSVNAFPNPAINNLTIEFSIKEKATLKVTIKDLLGNILAQQLLKEPSISTTNKLDFSTSNLSSGIYVYTIESEKEQVNKLFSVIK